MSRRPGGGPTKVDLFFYALALVFAAIALATCTGGVTPPS